MSRTIDLSGGAGRPTIKLQQGGWVARVQAVKVNVTPEFRVLRAWLLGAMPSCLYRLPGICSGKATVADHWTPTSVAPHLAMEPTNLVPACRHCHDVLTKKFDAVGGIIGNVVKGKPDPRDARYYEIINTALDANTRRRAFKQLKGEVLC
jgi:hypothetical protein